MTPKESTHPRHSASKQHHPSLRGGEVEVEFTRCLLPIGHSGEERLIVDVDLRPVKVDQRVGLERGRSRALGCGCRMNTQGRVRRDVSQRGV